MNHNKLITVMYIMTLYTFETVYIDVYSQYIIYNNNNILFYSDIFIEQTFCMYIQNICRGSVSPVQVKVEAHATIILQHQDHKNMLIFGRDSGMVSSNGMRRGVVEASENLNHIIFQ